MLELRVKPTKKRQFLMKGMPVTILLTNNSQENIQISDKSMEIEYVEDGQTLGWHSRWTEDEVFIEIGVGESYEMKLEKKRLFEFSTTYKGKQAVESFTFGINALFNCNNESPRKQIVCKSINTIDIDIEIDYTNTELLKTPNGEDSCYMKYNDDILYISRFSRAYEPSAKKLKIDKKSYKVLNASYIVDDEKVFRDGKLQKIKADGFKVYNDLFAGSEEMILTTFGNAKIKDPNTFEVFNVYGKVNCRKGFARDKYNLYFFGEDSNSSHAKVVKSCKNPQTFKDLFALEDSFYPKVYGQCERTVYIDAASISMCDASSWENMGHFSKDKKNVFYSTYKLKGVDIASFELIQDPKSDNEKYNTLKKSRWAKDKNNYYSGTRTLTKEQYEEAIAKALKRNEKDEMSS